MHIYRKIINLLFIVGFVSIWLVYSFPADVFARNNRSNEPDVKDVQVGSPVESDGVLVKFKDQKAGVEYLATMPQDVAKVRKHINAINVWLLKSDGISDQALLEQLMADDAVLWAELNGLMHITALEPDDPYYPGYQENLRVIEMPDAWGISTGTGNVIAIIDTGIDMTHLDLKDKIWQNSDEIPGNGIDDDQNGYIDDVRGWDFVNNDNSPQDDHWHGSHVAGIAAANTDNSIGIAGISWGTKLMPLKACNITGNCYFSDAASAVIYAVNNGAKVLNMSFGGPENNSTLEDALYYGFEHGVIMVASTGNYLTDVFFPASSVYTIAVSATDNVDEIWNDGALGSNFGEEVDIAAPGVSIVSTIPDDRYEYGYATGTSMATPHISGVASLIWSVNPLLTADQVKQVLLTTAVDISDPGFDIYTGYGRVDAYAALAYALVNLPEMQTLYFPLIQYEYSDAQKF